MARAIRSVSIAVGFLQVACKMFKATSTSKLEGHTYCSQSHRLGTIMVCKEDGCEEQYSHWSKAPMRGVDVGDTTYFYTTEELEAKADELPKYDTMQVARVVPFKEVGVLHTFGESYYLLPPEDANTVSLKAYRLLVEALDNEGWAMLTKLTMRDKVHRYAVVPHAGSNVLVAVELGDRRPVPYESGKPIVSDIERQQIRDFLKAAFTEDAYVEADPDALFLLVEEKMEADLQKGLAQAPAAQPAQAVLQRIDK